MARGPRAAGLSRRHRFAARGSFAPALRSPRKIRGELAVLHVASGGGAGRIGIALTRRLVPLATDRNRFKRLVRETFRRHPVKKMLLDCVVTLRSRFRAADSRAAATEIVRLFDELAAVTR